MAVDSCSVGAEERFDVRGRDEPGTVEFTISSYPFPLDLVETLDCGAFDIQSSLV